MEKYELYNLKSENYHREQKAIKSLLIFLCLSYERGRKYINGMDSLTVLCRAFLRHVCRYIVLYTCFIYTVYIIYPIPTLILDYGSIAIYINT